MTRRILWRYLDQDDASLAKGGIRPPAYQGDAGLDLVAGEDAVIYPPPRGPSIVHTGIQIALPEDMAAIVLPRSSAWRAGILVLSALVDSGYRGEILVGAFSLSEHKVKVKAGSSIAQLVPFQTQTMVLSYSTAPLPLSERGTKGFGSSGE